MEKGSDISVFVGREGFINRLSRLIRANSSPGRGLKIISIYGKSGVGKSFLINKVLQQEHSFLDRQLVLKIYRLPLMSLPQVLLQVVESSGLGNGSFRKTRGLINGARAVDKKFLRHVEKKSPQLRRAIENLGVVGIKWALKQYHLTPDILGIDIAEQDIRELVNFAQRETSRFVDRMLKTPRYWAEVDLETFAGEALWEDISRVVNTAEKYRRQKTPPFRRFPYKHSLLFIIDDYEGISPLMEKTFLRLASRLEKAAFNSLLVFVGRNELSWMSTWRYFSAFREESIRLDVFSEQEARKYLLLKGINNPHMEKEILARSYRLPLLLEILTDVYIKGRKTNWIEEYFRRITYHMNKKQREWLEMLSFIDGRIDEDVIAAIVGSREMAQEIFEWFKQEGTAHISTEKGWEIDPIVRSLIREKVWQDSQLRAEKYRRVAGIAQQQVQKEIQAWNS